MQRDGRVAARLSGAPLSDVADSARGHADQFADFPKREPGFAQIGNAL